jgi:hypothetical protein
MCVCVCLHVNAPIRPTGAALATCAAGGSAAAATPLPATGGAVNGAVNVNSFFNLAQGASASFSKTVNQMAVSILDYPACVKVTVVSPTISTAICALVARCAMFACQFATELSRVVIHH